MTQVQDRQHLQLEYIQSRSDSFCRSSCWSRDRIPIHQYELDVFVLCSSLMTCPSFLNPCFSGMFFVHNDHLYSFSLLAVILLFYFFSWENLLFFCRETYTHWSSVRVFHNYSNSIHDLKIFCHCRTLTWNFFPCFYSCRICWSSTPLGSILHWRFVSHLMM